MNRAAFHAALLCESLPFDPAKDTFVRDGIRWTQQQHWQWWLRDQRSDDARTIYNRVQNPAMLAWLARGLDLPADVVERADDISARGISSANCAAIRELIPWSSVAPRLLVLQQKGMV